MTATPTGAAGTLTVVGVGTDGGPPASASASASASGVSAGASALAAARVVVGAPRHLADAAPPAGCATVLLGPLAPALVRLRASVDAGDPAVVLASGDPGFFGIVRRLRAEGYGPAVVPAVSSVATAFARVGLPWDGAAVVSAHGRDLGPALNACRALPVVAVLTEPGAGAAELGAGLAGWERRLVVAEHLGTADERVTEVSPSEAAAGVWGHPHVVLSLAPSVHQDAGGGMRADNQPAAAPTSGWALPERAYAHRDSMITKAEVRALAVAWLHPRLGRLVWDVGAGSGSVGVECALLGAAVIAVDDDPQACALVAENGRRHGVAPAVRVVTGAAPEALAGLPAPDAVFVGGGGLSALAGAIEARPGRIVVALAALDRVATTVQVLRRNGYDVEGCQLAASRLSDLPGGSVRLTATNPVVLIKAELS